MPGHSVGATRLHNLINGRWETARTDRYENVYNPATAEVTAQVPLSTGADVEAAVEAAVKAFRGLLNAT